MPLVEETDRRFLNLENRIGVFVAGAIIGVFLLVLFIGVQHGLFTAKRDIYFVAASAGHIEEGQAVKLSGLQIGKVSKITLEGVAKVRVDLSIDKKYMKWIKTGSKVRLANKGIMGVSALEIVPGSPAAGQVSAGGQIGFEQSVGLNEMAEELRGQIEASLSQVRGILAYVNDPNGDIKRTLHNMRVLSAGLAATRDDADRLLARAGMTLNATSSEVNSFVASSGRVVKNTDHMVKRLDKDLPVLLKTAEKSMENVQEASGDIRKAAEANSGKIAPLLDNGFRIEDDALKITGSVKKTWPISTHIKQEKEKGVRQDSDD